MTAPDSSAAPARATGPARGPGSRWRPGATRRPAAGGPQRPSGRRGAPSRLRRRVGASLRMVAALALVGGLYALFAPGLKPAAADDTTLSYAAQQGNAIYDNSCISCHGANLQGVEGRGPSLIGVGSAAVEFQVGTGRMPMTRQEAQAERKPPVFTPEQVTQLAQFVQEIGGGPQLPVGDKLAATGEDDIAAGGELFRINCSSCHAFGGGGGALSSGKFAPGLENATDRDIYAAMLTGPQNMPVFGDNQLTPEEKMQIIAYIQNLNSDQDPGGWGLGRLGPVPEGLAIFLIGMVGLVLATVWIAGKS